MQNNKYIHRTSALIVLLLVIMFIPVGCAKYLNNDIEEKTDVVRPKDKQREIIVSKARNVVVVFFATPDNKNLVPVTLDVNPTEEMAKVATEKLLAGTSDETLKSPIPEGTKLKDLYKFENIAYVDLTEEFLHAESEEAASTAVQSLIFTLTEFQQVDSIQILIDGKVPSKPYGKIDITKTLHKPEKINFYGKGKKNFYKVYYSDNNAIFMIPLTFSSKREITPQIVVEQLLKDPPQESNLRKSPIWSGTRLIGIEVKERTAYVNFSKELIGYGGGAANETSLVKALTFTLTELPDVQNVQLLIEGQKPEYLPEGTDTATPWERPEKLNYFQK